MRWILAANILISLEAISRNQKNHAIYAPPNIVCNILRWHQTYINPYMLLIYINDLFYESYAVTTWERWVPSLPPHRSSFWGRFHMARGGSLRDLLYAYFTQETAISLVLCALSQSTTISLAWLLVGVYSINLHYILYEGVCVYSTMFSMAIRAIFFAKKSRKHTHTHTTYAQPLAHMTP